MLAARTRLSILTVLILMVSPLQAQTVSMNILTDGAAVNRYPGVDGLVGTGDDVVSADTTANNGSDPNEAGSYGFNAFNFGGSTGENTLPEGFNAITFVQGTVEVNVGALTGGGGAIISGLDISSGTEPFPGHGDYTATATAINGGSFNQSTGEFTLDLDISFLINGNTSTEPGLVLTGNAVYVSAANFGASGNSYADTVLAPLAQAQGASSLAFFDGTGTLPNLGFPIRFVIAATEGGSGAGFAINQGITGSWFNPATSGQGFLIDVDPDTSFIFIAWFTYDDASPAKLGAPEHRWLTAQGTYAGGSATLPLFVTSGGVFDSPQTVSTDQDGTMTISFSDCSTGSVSYQIPSADRSGTIPIQRLLPSTAALCQSLQGQ